MKYSITDKICAYTAPEYASMPFHIQIIRYVDQGAKSCIPRNKGAILCMCNPLWTTTSFDLLEWLKLVGVSVQIWSLAFCRSVKLDVLRLRITDVSFCLPLRICYLLCSIVWKRNWISSVFVNSVNGIDLFHCTVCLRVLFDLKTTAYEQWQPTKI